MRGVIFVTHSWAAASEVFISRRIEILADAGLLRAVVLTHDAYQGQFRGLPVLGLLRPQTFAQRLRYRIQRRLGRVPSMSDQFEAILRRFDVDTIFVNYGISAIAIKPALEHATQRLIVHLSGFDTQADLRQHNLQPVHDPGYLQALQPILRRSSILITSEEGVRRMQDWDIDPTQVIVKPVGVEVPDAPPAHSGAQSVKILHLGRLVDCKAPDRTLHAFELACERGLQGELIIAGDGPLRVMCDLLHVRSPWKDRITLLGAVNREKAQALYHECDIFTQHSIVGELTGQIELLGVSPIEAMAHALPVVSCPVGGIRETIIDGETGILTPPADDMAQAEAFLRLARDPALRLQMGLAGWQRARDNYTIEAERAALLSILDAQ